MLGSVIRLPMWEMRMMVVISTVITPKTMAAMRPYRTYWNILDSW